jgi:uncharacterized protein
MPVFSGRFQGRQAVAGILALIALAFLLLPSLARAQTFPALTGRVVDGANIIPADEKVRLEQKLTALEQQSGRQLVVTTVPDLQGYEISDYGYQLGRSWGIGEKDKNTGAILLIAPKERKVRIEVGYGLEGVLTDGISTLIIQQEIVPRFKAGDMPGGIEAGADAIIRQITLPPGEATASAAAVAARPPSKGGIDPGTVFFILIVIFFFVIPAIRRAVGGRRYNGGSGLAPLIVFDVLSHMASSGGGGGGGSNWGGGGGFSGGGGSFGGGGASGSW